MVVFSRAQDGGCGVHSGSIVGETGSKSKGKARQVRRIRYQSPRITATPMATKKTRTYFMGYYLRAPHAASALLAPQLLHALLGLSDQPWVSGKG